MYEACDKTLFPSDRCASVQPLSCAVSSGHRFCYTGHYSTVLFIDSILVVIQVIAVHCTALRSLDLHGCAQITGHSVSVLATHCTELEVLINCNPLTLDSVSLPTASQPQSMSTRTKQPRGSGQALHRCGVVEGAEGSGAKIEPAALRSPHGAPISNIYSKLLRSAGSRPRLFKAVHLWSSWTSHYARSSPTPHCSRSHYMAIS